MFLKYGVMYEALGDALVRRSLHRFAELFQLFKLLGSLIKTITSGFLALCEEVGCI